MRIVIIICILFPSLSICNAQVLVNESKLWSNLEFGTEQPENQNYHSYWIKFKGDTLIHDTLYMKVFRSDDSLHVNWISYGLMREDSSKKVFAYKIPNITYSQSEVLIYDFSLTKGDSILTNNGGYYIHVDSVSYITLGSRQFKVIYFPFDIKWIEGIGSLDGIFGGINNMFLTGVNRYLVYYSENDSLIYHNDIYNSCYVHHFPFGYDQILKIRDIFDFQIGDEFHSKTTFNGLGPPNSDRVTVIGKSFSANNDSITYKFHHDRYSTYVNNQHLDYLFDQFDSTETYTNLYSPILNIISADFTTIGLHLYSDTLCRTTINGMYIRDPNNFEGDYNIYEYGRGLGRTKFINEAPEGSWEITMFYYNKQGVKCGNPDLTTNTVEQETDEYLKIYPNPASNFLIIETNIDGPFSVRIYDMTGSIIQSIESKPKQANIDFSLTPSGIYIVEINKDNKFIHKKILKL